MSKLAELQADILLQEALDKSVAQNPNSQVHAKAKAFIDSSVNPRRALVDNVINGGKAFRGGDK
ncbi:MAG: hypothetical protein K0U41_03770 [Gammaproteobacteria bacterium]|nr:hypothetical protein [Gammaproteobacteria bacterium]